MLFNVVGVDVEVDIFAVVGVDHEYIGVDGANDRESAWEEIGERKVRGAEARGGGGEEQSCKKIQTIKTVLGY